MKSIIEDMHVVSRLKCGEDSSPKLTALIDVLEKRMSMEVDEHKGREISSERAASLVSAKVQLLQRVAFRHFESPLQDFALASVSSALDMLSSNSKAQTTFEDMKDEDLRKLMLLTGLISEPGAKVLKGYALEPNELNRKLLLQILVDEHRLNTKELRIHKFTLDKTKAGLSTIMPSMAGQFLSIQDFVERLYNLKSSELAELCTGLVEDATMKLFPSANVSGWSRMGTRLSGCRLRSVTKPTKIDALEEFESVRLELQFSLDGTPKKVMNEWDSLRDGDPLFLVKVSPEAEVVAIRLCEVDNSVIAIPDNPHRTAIVRLDVDQYVRDKADGVEYAAFSVLVRCNADVTRLKHELAALEGVLALKESMERKVPGWLKKAFLGHSPPRSLGQFFGSTANDLASTGISLLTITPGTCECSFSVAVRSCVIMSTVNPAYGIATILSPLLKPNGK